MSSSQTIENWKAASLDLGFQFVAPFMIDGEKEHLEYFAHLPQFGSKRGMLLIVGPYTACQLRTATALGFGCSCLSEASAAYDRESFIEMLSDWGWTGSSKERPSWLK